MKNKLKSKIKIIILFIFIFSFLFQNVANCEPAEDGDGTEDTYYSDDNDVDYLEDNDDYSDAMLGDTGDGDDSETSENDGADSGGLSWTDTSTSTTTTTTSTNINGNTAIIEKAQEIIEYMSGDNPNNRKWWYARGVSGRRTWEDAKKVQTSSCATFVTWVLQETGYLTKGKIISHRKVGTSFSSVKSSYASNLNSDTWYDLTGSTVKTANYDDLLPGDVVIVENPNGNPPWRSIAIYAGENSSGQNLYYSAVNDGALKREYNKKGPGTIPEFDKNNLIIVIRFDGGNTSTTSSDTIWEFEARCFANIFIIIGDFLQNLIDTTGTNATSYNSIVSSIGVIQADSDLNDEINVQEGNDIEDVDDSILKVATIKSTTEASDGTTKTIYSTATLIPVIPVEAYSSSIEKIDFFDIDFLSTSSTNSNKLWKFLSKWIKVWARIVLYVAVILLMTIIIWNAVVIVTASIRDNPASAERAKNIINNIFKTVLYIIGVYLIMFIMVYAYKYAISLFTGENDTSYIIRLNVEDVYTFNTNITGYLRYKAMAASAITMFSNAALYALTAVFNCIYFVAMFARMLALAGLTIIAPLTALSVLKEDKIKAKNGIFNLLNFDVWLKTYSAITWIPLLLVIIIRVIVTIS